MSGGISFYGLNQGTLFPVVLDDLVPADPMCRAIDAFVESLGMSELGLERAQTAERASGRHQRSQDGPCQKTTPAVLGTFRVGGRGFARCCAGAGRQFSLKWKRGGGRHCVKYSGESCFSAVCPGTKVGSRVCFCVESGRK